MGGESCPPRAPSGNQEQDLAWRCITMNKAVVDGLVMLALQRGNLMNRDLMAVV